MSPKSLLRAHSPSPLRDLAEGEFQRIIPDVGGRDPEKVKRVLLCSGKVYYDLATAREQKKRADVAIIRLEQLYPLRATELQEVLAPYGDGTDLVWVQEEPWNMGAWYTLNARIPNKIVGRLTLRCVARAESASPATGSHAAHVYEQQKLIEEAFEGL
jgi:2-oxoglutarate dehydrogenase E1 component